MPIQVGEDHRKEKCLHIGPWGGVKKKKGKAKRGGYVKDWASRRDRQIIDENRKKKNRLGGKLSI